MFLGLGAFFFELVHVFLDLAQGGGNLDIETRCMQEGVERNGGTCRYWSQVTAENWWERGRWERGKLDIETRMNARSCWDEKQKSRYWAQMTVHARSCGETKGGKLRYWNGMNAGSCWGAQVGGTLGGHGGNRYKTKWMQEVAQGHREYWSKMNAVQQVVEGHRGGSLDVKTKWTQKVMGRLRGKYRYWNPMNAGSLGSLMRGTGGKLYIETRWAQEVVERQGGKLRRWNQVEMHAKSC